MHLLSVILPRKDQRSQLNSPLLPSLNPLTSVPVLLNLPRGPTRLHGGNETCYLDPIPPHLVMACLPTLSPLISTIINSFLTNNLCESCQSGFRSHHSAQTALLLSSDAGNLNILILLYLRKAFFNHSILLSRLETIFNITGTALSSLKPYLYDRYQSISDNNCKSPSAHLPQGVQFSAPSSSSSWSNNPSP